MYQRNCVRRILSSRAMPRSRERRRIWGARSGAAPRSKSARPRRAIQKRLLRCQHRPGRSPPVSQCDRKSTRRSRNARAARQAAAAAPARAARLASAAAGASERARRMAEVATRTAATERRVARERATRG